MFRRLATVALCAVVGAGCTSGSDETTTTTSTVTVAPTTTTVGAIVDDGPVYKWWNDRVFYEVFVRSFKDSDGDGVGDLTGLTESLDYLNDGDPATTDDLGITGIWLMPIFPSPSYHGYDVVDYRAVNPDYGTMDEFEAFLDAAHERGIAVIIDLVINHTSIQHPWFVAAQADDPAYRDWYIWSDTDPATVGPWGQDVWHEGENGFYFGLFWEGMPDLNLENDAVTAEVYDIARFWLEDVGVDGFRLDAARHLIEEGEVMADTPSTVAWLEGFNQYVHEMSPDALVLGEVWSPTLDVASYVPDALDIAFEFALAEAAGRTSAVADASVLEAVMERVVGAYPAGQYASFLTNHDMDRLMSVVGGNVAIAKLAAVWLLTSPGVPFVYYGEEVGLAGTKPDERIRTPMPWTGEAPGVGFTTGDPWEPADAGFAEHNIAVESDDPASLLSLYRDLIHLRNDSLALRRGELIEVETGSATVFAYLRSAGEDHVLVVGNISPDATAITLDLATGPLEGMKGVVTVVGPGALPPDVTERGGFLEYSPVASLPGYGTLVVRFTADEQPPPESTTTTTSAPETQATPEDAAVAAAALADFDVSGNLISPEFTLRVSGLELGLTEELGEEAVADWDGDGAHTVTDIILQQASLARVFRVRAEPDCVAAGGAVSCSVVETDLFLDLAGIEPPPNDYTVWVQDGLVVGLEPLTPEASTDREFAASKWSEQLVVFEQWVADNHPDQYPVVFSGECCAGDGSNFIFTPATADRWETLLGEWSPPSTS
jgi:alpha-amylase